MGELKTLNLIARDMYSHNSFMTIIYALSNNDLDSLTIKKIENLTFYSNLTSSEKSNLLSVMYDMCEIISKNNWSLRESALA